MKTSWEIKHHYETKGYEVVREYLDELKALIASHVATLQPDRLDEHSALAMLDSHFQKFISQNRGIIEALHEIRSMSGNQLAHRQEKMKALVDQFLNSLEGKNYLKEAARELLDNIQEKTFADITNPA